jgi:hypothetical protein
MAVSQVPVPAVSGGLQQYEQWFTTSGTWSVPSSVKTAEVTLVGGGGAGASSVGGSAGGYIKRVVDVSAFAGSTITVTIGAGGVTAGTNTNGGNTTFGSLLAAYGAQSLGLTNATAMMGGLGNAPSGINEVVNGSVGGIASLRTYVVPSINANNSVQAAPYYTCTGTTYGRANGISLLFDNAGVTASNMAAYTSTDGITWTTTTSAIPTITSAPAASSTVFVAIPTASTATSYYSANGTTWSTGTLSSTGSWTGVVANGSTFLAYQGNTNGSTSTNGSTWTAQTLPFTPAYMFSAGSYFFLSHSAGLSYSTTGATGSWTSATGVAANFNFVGYANGNYVARALYSNTVYYSTNGTSWSNTTMPTTSKFQGTVGTNIKTFYQIGNNFFVHSYGSSATGTTIFTSVNGSTWTEVGVYPLLASNQTSQNNAYSISSYVSNVAVYCGNTRYALPLTNSQAGPNTYLFLALFSDGFGGGLMGVVSSSLTNQYWGGVGATGNPYNLMYTNSTNSYYGNINNGSPEGFARGGSNYAPQNFMVNNTPYPTSPNYGDGAPSGTSIVGAGQGLCIVRWWQ